MKNHNKKRALYSSIISLILCVTMLLGTTMAWFTDSVSNTGNRIVTGELSVDLLKYDGAGYKSIADGKGDIFATESEEGERLNGILWEPGKTEVVLLQVANIANLALNYNIILDVRYDGEAPLEEALSYAVIPNVAEGDELPANVLKYSDMKIAGWQSITVLNGIDTGVVKTGVTKAAPKGALLAGESDYFALAVHMNEDAGNAYQNQEILIDVKVEAKQMPSENDSFGNQYDAGAEYYNEEYMDALTYHVSTTGDDNNPGTKDKPFATVAKANEVIKALDHENNNVLVLIHGGTYFMSGDTAFSGTEAGGTGDNKVVYKAAGDGEVVFSGFIDIPVSTGVSADGTTVGELTSEKVQKELLKFDLSPYGVDYKQFEFTRNDNGEYQDKLTVPGAITDYYSLLLNGKAQIIATWPNYGDYSVIDTVVNKGGTSAEDGPVFKYTYSNIDNWSEESLREAVVRGYLSRRYREEWNLIESIDTEKKEITLLSQADFDMQVGRNWRVINIAEEIDVPGEFCVDWQHDDLALYYYPSYDLSSDDVLQLSVTKGASWIFENTQNIVIDGIKFTGIRNNDRSQGVLTVKDSDNLEIRNCTFTYNDGGANIAITGKNNIVEACGFYNCGATGVFLYGGGDYTTLERQNNVITNNHFYNSGNSNWQNTGGAVSNNLTAAYSGATVGNTINNNLIHHIYGSVNIYVNGIEYDVSYNEISNGLRTQVDNGLIYSGRRAQSQGMTFNYNYLHDFGSVMEETSTVNAIYVDDWNSGHTANNNIIVANSNKPTRSILSVGAYNTFKYNILANSTYGISQVYRSDLVGESSVLTSFVNSISTFSDTWKAKYPHMLTLQKAAVNGKPFPTMNNVITDNIAYNAAYDISQEAVDLGGDIANNVTVTGTSGVFVDPENHDWRITSEYATANNLNENMITEANFSMDQIGIQRDVWAISNPLDSFKQVYPKNGSSDVQPNNVTLNWEQALFADEYEYVVAKDAAFTDVVASGKTITEHVNIGKLKPEETYYWKITAVNTTKQLGASWDSEEVFSFTTDIERADKSQLVSAIAVATESFAEVKDGEVDKVGDYKIGTEAKLQKLLDTANAVNANERATQDEVDELTAKLTNAVNGPSAYKYKGYVTLDTSDESKWRATQDNTTFAVEDGVMSVTGKKVVTYTDIIPNHNMITFDVKADLSKMLGFMVRSTKQDAVDVYKGLSYFFWITSSKIELQAETDAGTQNVIASLPTNDYIKSETWHNIRIEAVDLEGGGVKIALYVDDQEVLSHVDNTYLRYEEGTFAVQSGAGNVQIRAAEQMPTFEDVEIVDKSKLASAIAVATESFAAVEDGVENKVGDYKIGTSEKLQNLLEAANEVNAKEKSTQDEVDELTTQLTTATNLLNTSAYKYKGYVTLDTSNVNNWSTPAKYVTPISVEDGILTVDGKHCVSYTETLPNYNMVTFDVNVDLSDGWFGIMLRDTKEEKHWYVFDGNSYFFWIYSNKIELRTNTPDGGHVSIASCDSNDYLTSNEWHNIRVEAIDLEEGGVKIVLYVDDHEVLSHVDTKYSLFEEGTFGVNSYKTTGMKIRAASELPTFTN